MKKLSLVILLLLMNSLLESCGPDDNFCYEIEIISVSNYSINDFTTPSSGETVNANDYAILLSGEGTGEYCLNRSLSGGGLYADIAYVVTDKVTNITITSNADLSAAYPAGSELKELFVPVYIDPMCASEPGGSECVYDYVDDVLTNSLENTINGEMGSRIYFDSKNEVTSLLHLFALRTDETIISNAHEITVTFEFESGRLTELTTSRVILN